MPRLFVAIDLPTIATSELARIQPPPTAGVRLVAPGQMHLTLHFIGKSDFEQIAKALHTVVASVFPLSIEKVGQFASARREVTLWAGIRANSELLMLHNAVAESLAVVGFRPEIRPFSPHITLARCKRGTPARLVDEFLARNEQWSVPSFSVTEFALYSSKLTGDVPEYRRERAYPLR